PAVPSHHQRRGLGAGRGAGASGGGHGRSSLVTPGTLGAAGTAGAAASVGSALRIGTRASDLALTQSGQVGEALVAGTDHAVELVHLSTRGDRDRISPLA